jgi:signal peptidase II
MADPFRENRVKFIGPFTRLGLLYAVLTFAIDQLSKYWVLQIVDLDVRGNVPLLPFLDLTMAWNKGISYGLLATHAQEILIGVSLVICVLLLNWLARASGPLAAASLGLIIGGAVANALDRFLHGAVVDFVHFFWGNWSWYIFNVADTAIVAGVALLFYDGLLRGKPG